MERIIDELNKALEETKNGNPKALILIAPTGYGKTRIVEEWIKNNNLSFWKVFCNTLLYNKANIYGYTLKDMMSCIKFDKDVIFFDMIDSCDNNVRTVLKEKINEIKAHSKALIVATGWNEPHFNFEKMSKDFLNTFDVLIDLHS